MTVMTAAARFWPRYLAEHSHASNRAFHELADVVVAGGVVAAIATGTWWLAAGGVLGAYAVAFGGHFIVERNRPASLSHPVLAAICNARMFWLSVTGRLEAEMKRLGIESRGEAFFGVAAWRRLWS